MITENEKSIYNTYLATSRSAKNKPFKLRKNFAKLETDDNYIYVQKLARFFDNHPNIKQQEFFKAPFVLHPEEDFHLEFFTKPRAVKTYVNFLNYIDSLPWDSEYHMQQSVKALKYIKRFCEQRSISSVEDYMVYKSNNLYPDWFIHAKQRFINLPTLHGLPNVLMSTNNFPADITEMFVGDFISQYYSNKQKFKGKIRSLIKNGIIKINESLVEKH